MVTFNETLLAITQINSHPGENNSSPPQKWHIHQDRAAEMLNIDETEDTTRAAILGEFVNCLKNGGSGSRKAGTFVANPSPYNKTKIDIFDPSPNALNFHGIKYRWRQQTSHVSSTPSSDAILQDAVYYSFGGRETKVSLNSQLELMRYVTGVDGQLQRQFGPIATERQNLWYLWATNDPAGAAFHNKEEHLPLIAYKFRNLWDTTTIDDDTEVEDITQTQLKAVKREIIDALVASFVLDPSAVGIRPTRRSRRISGERGGADDTEISAAPDKERKRKRHEANQSDDLAETVSDSDEDPGVCERDGKKLFDIDATLTRLRQLSLERVGVLEVAYNCAHARDSYATITRKLLDLNQLPIAEEEYKVIVQMQKTDLSRFMINFKSFKAEINKQQLLKIKDGQLLLDYLCTIEVINGGRKQTIALCDRQGHLKPEQAYILRHILYTHPRIGLKNIIELYVDYHVLITGEVPCEGDFPSTSTLRCHIAMLNALDRYEQGQQIVKSLTRLSPRGSPRYGALVSDDTKHGKFDSHHGLLVTSERESAHQGQERTGLNEWFVSPMFTVLANAPAPTKTSEGNSDFNIETLTSHIPVEGLAQLNGHTTDNANDARAEALRSFQKVLEHAAEKGLNDAVMAYGVERWAVLLGDLFHVDALAIKHASIGSCGNTVKGKYDELHHRKTIQNLRDVFVRDIHVIKAIFYKILGKELVDQLGLPRPLCEKDARWRTNALAAREILKYMAVEDEDGTNFWVLFCREVSHLYTDFRLERLGAEAEMLMAPSIVAGLHFEAELGDFFDITHDFHAQVGQLADRPGFRALEIARLYADFVLPYWEEAKKNPSSKFPNTFAYLDTIADPTLKEMKREQFEQGISDGHAEVAKMAEQLVQGPWLITLITHPAYGADVARAMFKVAKEEGVSYFEDNDTLIDWSIYDNGEEPSSAYEAFYAEANKDREKTVHFLQQFGLMTLATRDEAKKLTKEKPGCRDVKSERWLLDFARDYPLLFDKLHAQFALYPSNTRIGEQMHGVARNWYDFQASSESVTARHNYIMGTVYLDRRDRRKMSAEATSKSSTSTTKKRKVQQGAKKHNDKKYLLVELGRQLKEHASEYTSVKLNDRIPLQVRNDNSISKIKERGTDRARKLLAKKKFDHAKQVAQKRIEKGYRPPSLREQKQRALDLRTDHDIAWRSRALTELYNKLKRVSFKSYWRNIKRDEFYTEIEHVLPAFYQRCPNMTSMSKKALLDTGTTRFDNVFLFLSHIQQIADHKIEDDISSPDRVEELRDLSREEYLLEFVKVGESVHLQTVAEEQANKTKAMYALMEELAKNKTELTYDAVYERADYSVMTTSYCEGDFMYCSEDEEDEDA